MSKLYGGMAGLKYIGEDYNLINGIIIRPVFAHLFAPYMMAFKAPTKYAHHEGPWKAAKGGVSFNIWIEIEVDETQFNSDLYSQEDIIFVIAFLVKISDHPYASIPILSDVSFSRILESEVEPNLVPNETKLRRFIAARNSEPLLGIKTLDWIKDNFKMILQLLKNDARFFSVFKAMEAACTVESNSSSLMLIWGAIEQLFSTNGGELKFRVSTNLACYLEPAGEARLQLFSKIKKLYDQRSMAAHTTKDIDSDPVIQSFIILRNAIIKIIDLGTIPDQDSFEKRLFTES